MKSYFLKIRNGSLFPILKWPVPPCFLIIYTRIRMMQVDSVEHVNTSSVWLIKSAVLAPEVREWNLNEDNVWVPADEPVVLVVEERYCVVDGVRGTQAQETRLRYVSPDTTTENDIDLSAAEINGPRWAHAGVTPDWAK